MFTKYATPLFFRYAQCSTSQISPVRTEHGNAEGLAGRGVVSIAIVGRGIRLFSDILSCGEEGQWY